MPVILLALVALLAVLYVALPLLREPTRADHVDTLSASQRERLRLREERDAALAALKELEFDHRTGAIADEDYAALVGEYRARATAALRALEDTAE